VIGGVFKPNVFKKIDFKVIAKILYKFHKLFHAEVNMFGLQVTNVNGQKLLKSSNSIKQVEFNLDAFIEDIDIQGGFIVKEIEKCNTSIFCN